MEDKIDIFVERLKKIGIEVTLIVNYPWVYLTTINGETVTEKQLSEHNWTLSIISILSEEFSFQNLRETFKLIRKYTINKNLFDKLMNVILLEKYPEDQEKLDYINSLKQSDKITNILSFLDDNNLWVKLLDSKQSKLEYIKDVINILIEYVKIGEIDKKNFGEVMTPIGLVKEMLNLLPIDVWSNPNLKWLDPCNGTGPYPILVIYKLMKGLVNWEPNEEKRYKHIVENMIYTCELQTRNVFLWLFAVDMKNEYRTNTYFGSFLDEKFDSHMKNVWCVDKFDIIIGNPPYMKSLHISFLEKSHNISDQVLFIHPSPWLFRRESIAKNPNNRIKSIRLINGNYYFKNAEFGAPLSITYLDRNISDSIYLQYDTTDEKFDVKSIPSGFWTPNEMMLSLNDKFKEITKDTNISKLLMKNDGSDFIISTPRICGHAVKRNSKEVFTTNDFYTMFYRNSNLIDKNTKNKVFIVNNEDERLRLINYMTTKICRFGLYLNKISQDAHIIKYLSNIPLPPLDKEYNTEELCELLNINEKEYDFIEKTISDYY